MKWRSGSALLFAAAFLVVTTAAPGCWNTLDEEARQTLSTMPTEDVFFELAARGQMDELSRVLEQRPELINAQGVNGRTILHYAAANGHGRLVDYLLSRGANPRLVDEEGNSPAEAALLNAETRIADRLREAARQTQ